MKKVFALDRVMGFRAWRTLNPVLQGGRRHIDCRAGAIALVRGFQYNLHLDSSLWNSVLALQPLCPHLSWWQLPRHHLYTWCLESSTYDQALETWKAFGCAEPPDPRPPFCPRIEWLGHTRCVVSVFSCPAVYLRVSNWFSVENTGAFSCF